MVIPGDIVNRGGGDLVVVDVDGDGVAVLRRPEDTEGLDLTGVDAEQLTAIGHLDSLDGWVEEEPGMWRKL